MPDFRGDGMFQSGEEGRDLPPAPEPSTSHGGTYDWTANPTPLPYHQPVARIAQVVAFRSVWNFGGQFSAYAGDEIEDIRVAPLDHGLVGEWRWLTSLPERTAMTCVVFHRGNVYVVAGYAGVPSRRVYRASLLADGSLTSWEREPDLPWGWWYGHQALVHEEVLYTFGGWRNQRIYAAEIREDGGLDPWEHVGHLPVALYSFVSIVGEGRIWLLGGKEIVADVQTIVPTVRWTELSTWPDGVWHEAAPMPRPLWFHRAAVRGRDWYVVGSGPTRTPIYHAFLGDDGSLSWDGTRVPPLPVPLREPGLIVSASGALHCFGGFSSDAIWNCRTDRRSYSSVAAPDPHVPISGAIRRVGGAPPGDPGLLPVYDVRGRVVGRIRPDVDPRSWALRTRPPGVYYCRLPYAGTAGSRKIVVVH